MKHQYASKWLLQIIDTSMFKSQSPIYSSMVLHSANVNLLPNKELQREQIALFSSVRQDIARLKSSSHNIKPPNRLVN
ncbi:unnamed protein product [Timema podura]|uniref:Uncharacterized protein n=2 Tax=Timema TaxID=61471 RepID=A0ABN7PBP8_TIMPD|nr:unnamed protein product [Timema podura]